jgi:hypothetical protein
MKGTPPAPSKSTGQNSSPDYVLADTAQERFTKIVSHGRPGFPPGQIRRCLIEVQRVKLVNSVNQFHAHGALNWISRVRCLTECVSTLIQTYGYGRLVDGGRMARLTHSRIIWIAEPGLIPKLVP